MVISFLCIAVFFLLTYTGYMASFVALSPYLALAICLAISGTAVFCSLKLFSRRNTYKNLMRFAALIISVALLGYVIYLFFIPTGDSAPIIGWFV